MRNWLFAALLALPLTALAGTQTVTLEVRNMTCSLCPITVKKALEKVPGVSGAKVDFDQKTAVVTFDPAKTQTAALIKATTNAGYPSVLRKQAP